MRNQRASSSPHEVYNKEGGDDEMSEDSITTSSPSSSSPRPTSNSNSNSMTTTTTTPPPLVAIDKESPPHTLTGLMVLVVALYTRTIMNVVDGTITPDNESSSLPFGMEIASGLKVATVSFLLYATLNFSDGELRRPHPMVWRFVHGVTVLHLMLIAFLVPQSPRIVDAVLQTLFDERIGTSNLPKDAMSQENYGANCTLTYDHVMDKVLDRFFVAHLLGWFVKALILRDWTVMWICSLLFEALEVSLQKPIPNFAECWWDRWLLDVFGCNLLGMAMGMRFAAWVGAKEYDWSGTIVRRERNRSKRAIKRVVLQFTPQTFNRRHEWHAFSSWRSFGVALLVVIGVQLAELNGFLLKSSLRIPTDSWINIARLFVMVPALYASVVELYAFSQEKTDRIGSTAWLVLCLTLFEFLLSMKNFKRRSAFDSDQLRVPPEVVIAWISTGALLLCATLVRAAKFDKRVGSRIIRVLAYLTPVPLLLLMAQDAWRSSSGVIVSVGNASLGVVHDCEI